MPEYHRLDLSLAHNFKNYGKRKWKSQFVIALYNCYGRKNAYSIYLKQNKYEMDTYQGFKMYLYQWVPSLTYNFWF